MTSTASVSLGLDFGTESVRALLVDLKGNECGSAVSSYQHGQILNELPESGRKLPPSYALQDPQDWLDSAARAVQAAVRQAKVVPDDIVGIGVDFTSCTMLPALRDGTPEETAKRQEATAAFFREKAATKLKTPYGLDYSPHYFRTSRQQKTGAEE